MILHLTLNAQINYDKFPENNSLIPRDISNNKAYISFNFSVQKTSNPFEYTLLKFKDDLLIEELPLRNIDSGNVQKFSIVDSIEATLNTYSYQLLYQGTIIKEAKNICAGDVYIIHGQSNAESSSHSDSCYIDYSNFIRTYGKAGETGYQKKWEIATGDGNRNSIGHIGQLGIAIGHHIISTNNVPVCILNGAVGGNQITYFLPDNSNINNSNTSYGRLLNRSIEANVVNNVRAIIWYQGENDAYRNTTKEDYIIHFTTLYKAWKTAFSSLERIYVFQIKNGCNLKKEQVGEIQNAQLELKKIFQDIELISTTNIKNASDTCHFNYSDGYKILGKKVYDLINHYQYHSTDTQGIFSPMVDSIFYKDNTLTLHLLKEESLQYESSVVKNFYVNENDVHPIAMSTSEKNIKLVFRNKIKSFDHLSFFNENENLKCSIYNSKDNALLSFYNMEINKENVDLKSTTYLNTPFINNSTLYCYSSILEATKIDIITSSTDGKIIKKTNDTLYLGENKFMLNLPINNLFLVEVIIHYKSGDKKYLLKAKK